MELFQELLKTDSWAGFLLVTWGMTVQAFCVATLLKLKIIEVTPKQQMNAGFFYLFIMALIAMTK